MTGAPEDNSPPDPRLRLMRETVTLLSELLQTLYPELPSADVITLDDFLTRYRLTELGAPAMEAIEQTQRINRSLNNYKQTGLSEFHIGLFYLYWDDCQGGIKQFALARQQWSFVDAVDSVCLAHFAEGRTYHLAYQYEVAMSHYGKAAQWLSRTHFTPPSASQDKFVAMMMQCLEEWQKKLREDMLAYFRAVQAAREAQATADEEEQQEQEREPEEETATQESEETAASTREDIPAASQPIAPLPYFNIGAEPNWSKTPIPAHRNLDENYAWYRVDETDEHFLPEVVEGTWVLVDKKTDEHEFKQDELIVVVPTDTITGAIVLGPRAPEQIFPRIYLASSQFEGSFVRDINTGKVVLSSQENAVSVSRNEVVGYVVGLWLNKAHL